MVKRNADLVIRAKDEAKGAIQSITGALEKFVGAQEGLQKTAGKTDSSLDRLSSGLTGLQKALGGVSSANKVDSELRKASAAIERMEASTKAAAGEAIGYARESLKAAQATKVLRAENERVGASLAKQTAAVDKAKTARAALNDITRRAAKDSVKLAAADSKLSNQLEEQRLKLTLASAAYRDLQNSIARTSGPTERLESRLSGISRVVRETEVSIQELKTTQTVVQNSFDATARSVQRASDAYSGTSAKLESQVSALKKLEAAQSELNGAVKTSARTQAVLEASAGKAAGALSRQTNQLDAAKTGYKELEVGAAGADKALAGLGARVRGTLLRSFGQQATQVAKLKQEYTETSGAATRLGRALAQAKNPSEQMISAFSRNVDAAARARQAYREQNTELAVMRRILKETGGDVDVFADRQLRFSTALERAAKAQKEYAIASAQASGANRSAAGGAERAAQAAERLAKATAAGGRAARRAAGETNTLAGAVRNFYGESRKALSFTQRLRGEVLALVAAYGGFFAAVQGIKQANELDFIRRNAERLGVELGTLAQEYTKFAVATKGTNLAGEETRRIFVSIAEAARVNKSTLPELQGVFVAITQIVNKGTVSMEELRQQLGDRLPGAIQIMADAAGVGVAELTEMVAAGKLSSDILSEFADELDGRFSKALPDALETTTTALGRLQNALFQAFLRVANGGFIERFTALLNDLTETVQSAQFLATLDRISTALASASDMVAFLVRNFDVLGAAITAFIGFKLAPFIIFLASRMGVLTGSSVSASRGFRALSVASNGATVSMSRTAVAVRGLTIAFRTLLSSTGIGLLVTAIGAGIGLWATRADDGTDALERHARAIDIVRNAYDQVGNSLVDIRVKLKEAFSVTDLRDNVRDLKDELTSVLTEFTLAQGQGGGTALTQLFGTNFVQVSRQYKDAIDAVLTATANGSSPVDEFADKIDAVNEQFRDGSTLNERFASQMNGLAKKVELTAGALEEAEAVLVIAAGSTVDATDAIDDLSGAVVTAAGTATKSVAQFKAFANALEELKKLVPDLADAMEILDEKAELRGALDAALALAQTYGEVAAAVALYGRALDSLDESAALKFFDDVGGGKAGKAFKLIADFEAFSPGAYYDVNAYRAGFGSDTTTDASGNVTAITSTSTVTLEEATRDLTRRIIEFQDTVKGQIGAERFDSFGEEQQAALTSIAYNYGSLPARIVNAIKTGNVDTISTAIDRLGTDNGGINQGRRTREATIFRGGGEADLGAYVDAEEDRQELAAEAAEDAADRAQATQDAIRDGQQEIDQQQLITDGREREAGILEAINAAKIDNADISQAELDTIAAQAGKLFDLKKAEEDRLSPLEAAEAAEQRIADLLDLQKNLKEELTDAISQGADANVTGNLRTELEGVNDLISESIENAIKLYEALGSSDPAIAAMISQLRLLQSTSGQVAGKVTIDWRAVEQQFANGLVTAVDNFVKKMDDGATASEAARFAFLTFASDFLRMIGQMILQQIALNIAQGITTALGVGVAHSGGVVGQRTAQRQVNPAVFAGAMRYHSGGIAGLRPNEVPTILERNEEVLTTSDPRHKFNGGGKASGGGGRNLRVVNVFDAVAAVAEALATSAGEEVFLNRVRSSKDGIKAALEI